MKLLSFTLVFLFCSICYSQQNQLKKSLEMTSNIDSYISHLIKRQGIPGVTLAIVRDGEIIYKNNFGYANIEHQVPISNESIFRLYSLTKPIVSVGIFQLIEEGKLDLNDPVSKYVFDLPTRWNTIKVKHLLSHSSGLPDMAPLPDFKDLSEEEAKNKVFEQELKFGKGEKYDYNQTGFWLLQKIIEKITDKDLATYIIEKQFNSNKNVFFSSDSRDIVLHRVTPYFPFEKGSLMIDHSYLQGSYAHSKNGLNINLEEFLKWDKYLKENKFLNKTSMSSMWETFPYTQSNKRFSYSWDKHIINGHVSYGFSGSLCTAYRIFPDDGLSIIFLSNGLSNWYNIDNIVNHIASIVDTDIIDINNFAFEHLLKATVENNQDAFIATYQKLKKSPFLVDNDFESSLNDVGYFWLLGLKNTAKAIEIFELNTKEFPNSWNTFDSLAEAYEKYGNSIKAILNYKRAMHLNSDEDYKVNTKLKIDKLNF